MKFFALLLAGLAAALLAAGLALLLWTLVRRRARHPERGGPRYREYRRSLGDREGPRAGSRK